MVFVFDRFFITHSTQNIVHIRSFLTILFLNEFKQRVIDNYTAQGLSYFENSSKCNLYQYIHDGHNRQFYLNRPVNSLY
jgi:hypothetical protein